SRLVGKHYDQLKKAASPAIIGFYREGNPALAADFADYTDQEVFDATAGHQKTAALPAGGKPRDVEFEILSSGEARIGEDAPGALIFAETLQRDAWDPRRARNLRGILR